MTARPTHRAGRSGYTLVEVLAASGLVAAAIGAASALSMTMTRQEELARGQAAAIRYAEALARLWQLGVDPATVMLAQTQGSPGSAGYNPMTYTISGASSASVGDDGGISEGNVEAATVTVTYLPYGNADSAPATIALDVLRPASSHR
jgi:type II secretory pathway pseudopilin PulG